MPNVNLDETESAIIAWVRENRRRIAGHDNAESAILLLGTPENTEMLIHELQDHCGGFTTTGGQTLAGQGDLHVWTSFVE